MMHLAIYTSMSRQRRASRANDVSVVAMETCLHSVSDVHLRHSVTVAP